MNNHLSDLLTEFKENVAESGDLGKFTAFIAEQTEKRQSLGVIIILALYTIYQEDLHKPKYTNIAHYVKNNMSAFKANTPEYNMKLANVVDKILVDVKMAIDGKFPYQDFNGNDIEPENLLMDSFCVTKMTQFLGAYNKTFDIPENMEIHERQEYMEKMRMVRQSLLQMFMDKTVKREEIRDFTEGLFAETVEDEDGNSALTVIENHRINDTVVQVTIEINGHEAYQKLEAAMLKLFNVPLMLVSE